MSLGEALDQYIAFLAERGSPIRDLLHEPKQPATIRDELNNMGLVASQDVVDWFTRLNGHEPFRGFLVFGNHVPYSFTQAVEAHKNNLEFAANDTDGDPNHPDPPSGSAYQPTWFPVAGGQPTLTSDLTDGTVRELWWDESPRRRFSSLTEFVVHEQGRIERGEFKIPTDGRIAKPHEPDVLSEWTGCNFTILRPLAMPDLNLSDFQSAIPHILSERKATRVKIQGATTGYVDDNNNIEPTQLEVCRQYFIGLGIEPARIEIEQIETEKTHIHEIWFFTAD